MQDNSKQLWDIPTRLFHWLLVCCVPASWISAETGNYEAHQWIGCLMIVLVLSRIVWGFVGSRHSRFADFVVGPRKALTYLRGQGAVSRGHNPLGGWSVLALLFLLLLQAVSGLFNTDDVFFSGPLYYMASTSLRGTMGQLHEITFNLLIALICLHILVVLYHQLRLKERLLQAMVRGSAEGREGAGALAPWWLAMLVVLLIGAALWWGLEQAPQPPPSIW